MDGRIDESHCHSLTEGKSYHTYISLIQTRQAPKHRTNPVHKEVPTVFPTDMSEVMALCFYDSHQ